MTEQDKSVGLRARLVAAGVELLALEGVHALTLREIARQAGVSHGAPRRYFATHAELLAAIAGHGFGELATALGLDAPAPASAPAADSAPLSAAAARARLDDLARGYLAFAAEQPGMFELMFRHDVLEGSGAELRRTSLPLFEAVTRLVAVIRPPAGEGDGGRVGDGGASPPTVAAAALWANLHGLAQLRAWGSLRLATGGDSVEPLLRATLDAHLGRDAG
ncbi:TetR/AcrR family transcriptional regulator [Kitasatospora sp. NPDC089913]|uniref:TetR/AcrR family transcriptional regulator n=1 Tax=Streptomycetaceae TaxID=2062 RepID=UPI00087D163D|nr:TetR/AcrR family transcriptional regulator [Streptomyces sp. TLI_053]SDT82543.1 transcriptional regulator, TetR family [Streptomyces sp. TLI_053]